MANKKFTKGNIVELNDSKYIPKWFKNLLANYSNTYLRVVSYDSQTESYSIAMYDNSSKELLKTLTKCKSHYLKKVKIDQEIQFEDSDSTTLKEDLYKSFMEALDYNLTLTKNDYNELSRTRDVRDNDYLKTTQDIKSDINEQNRIISSAKLELVRLNNLHFPTYLVSFVLFYF